MKKLFLGLLCTKLFSAQIGHITDINERNNEFYISTSDGAITKVIFYREDIFRIWVAPKGNFIDPSTSEETSIVVNKENPIKINISEEIDYYKLESNLCVLRIYKNPCTFSLYKKDNNTLLFKEIEPIVYGKNSYQTIQRNKDDYFYGCGMQNGHFCHNDRTIQIENIYDDKQNIWNEHGTPNAASFYMSLKGYGVFRNTYEGGSYEFLSTVKTLHKENRFDAYYFVGDLKGILEGSLGKLAHEIAEETAQELHNDMSGSETVGDIFQKLMKNPQKLLNMIKKVGNKLDEKLKSGEIKESELMKEASELMEKMKKMPGMGGMDKILSKMGVPGGKNINFNAMQSKMKSNIKAATQRERMLKKLEERRKQKLKLEKNMNDKSPIEFVHSSFGEGMEKSKRSERNKKRRKKKNKNKNKKK